MHSAQADAVRATARLAGTLQRMNETVISALADINITAIRVNNTLGAGSYADLVFSASAIVAYCEDDHKSAHYLRRPRLTVFSEPDFHSAPDRPVAMVYFPPLVFFHYYGTLSFSASCFCATSVIYYC